MLKRRTLAVEKRLAAIAAKRGEKRLQFIFCFGDGTEPPGEKDEARGEKDWPAIVFKMPRPLPPEGERFFRFDFGDGNQAGPLNEKTSDATEMSLVTEGEKE